ncbi:MAG: hypothetical protein BM564_08965 [Bacteroidetes bacterium MedPE-SWsnd-G2]|nr:MAG: hypothetical protein BM564_08965 [Bacteroidetes bacterium MedPE-SWsnd-G2]
MKVLIGFILLLSPAFTFAQEDLPKGSKSIPAVETEEKTKSDPKVILPETPASLSKNNNTTINNITVNNKVKIVNKPKSEFSMIDNSNLIDPGVLFQKRLEDKYKDKDIRDEYMSDQYLGDFKSNGEFVNIICRDHEYPDGDRVKVSVNEEVFLPNLLLTGGYKTFQIDLVEGFNKIDFLALNQGTSGPNTAEFQVYDDEGNLVSSNQWNLTTGVKATIIVIKDKP